MKNNNKELLRAILENQLAIKIVERKHMNPYDRYTIKAAIKEIKRQLIELKKL